MQQLKEQFNHKHDEYYNSEIYTLKQRSHYTIQCIDDSIQVYDDRQQFDCEEFNTLDEAMKYIIEKSDN